MEEITTPLDKLNSAFNKGNVYACLKAIAAGTITLEDMIEVCEPQRGGGESNTKEINGETYYYCRYAKDYFPLEDMQVSGGKSKGATKLAASIAYRIEKHSKEVEAEALALFVKGKYEEGAAKNAEAASIKAMLDDSSNFTKEAMATSKYNPEAGKQNNSSDDEDVL